MDKVLAGLCDEDDKLCHHLERDTLFSPGVITTAGQPKEFPFVTQYQNLQLRRNGSS